MQKTNFNEIVNDGKPPWIDWDRVRAKPGAIRMFSGLYVRPLALAEDLNDVIPQDIAHHLSLICRYTGAAPDHYSVAQHSVMAMLNAAEDGVTDPRLLMGVLLHDAAEAYFNDLASPVKNDSRMAWYRQEEDAARVLICNKFRASIDDELIEKYDKAAFADECELFADRVSVTQWMIPAQAESMFLSFFHDLDDKIDNLEESDVETDSSH